MIAWLELFYDLVFVAAILVLSAAVSHTHDVDKIVLVVAVFTSLWVIWLATTLFEDRHRADDMTQRVLVLAQMFLVAVVAMEAHAGVVRDARSLSIAYALLVATVAAMYARVPAGDSRRDLARRHARIGAASAGIFVVAAFVPEPARFVLWGLGAAGAVAAVVERPDAALGSAIDERHLMERFGAFTIIVCGEAFVKVAIAVSNSDVNQIDLIALAFQFVLMFAIWTCYFEDIPHAGIAPRRTALWVGLHLLLQLAIAGTAIGVSKLVQVRPLDAVPAEDILEITATLALVFVALALLGPCTRREPVRPLMVLRATAALAVVVVGTIAWLVPWIDVAEGVAALSVVAVVSAAAVYRSVATTTVAALA